MLSVAAYGINVEGVDAPHVTLRRIGLHRAAAIGRVCRCEKEPLAAREKPSAGSLPTDRHLGESGAVAAHDVLLVAGTAVARGLEGDPLTIGAEIRLRILAAVGELTDVRDMSFAAVGGDDAARGNCVGASTGARRRGAGRREAGSRNKDRERAEKTHGLNRRAVQPMRQCSRDTYLFDGCGVSSRCGGTRPPW